MMAKSDSPVALVTGATGLLGNNLVRLLVERGWQVRAVVRSVAKGQRLLGHLPSVSFVQGDLRDVDGFAQALNEVRVLFHTAAYFRESYQGGSHRSELEQVNVDGTQLLLDQAQRCRVGQVVHVSSIAAIRQGSAEQPATEEDLRSFADAPDPYYGSKILSDQNVLAFARHSSVMPTHLILPGWMYGPGDDGPTSAGQLVLDYIHRRLPGVFPVHFSVVDARDVALACLAVVEKADWPPTRRTIVAGRRLSLREIGTLLQEVSGIPMPGRTVPLPIMLLIAMVQEAYHRFSGKPVLLSWSAARTLFRERDGGYFNQSRAREELGITFRPFTETLRDTLAWYQNQGRLPDSFRLA